MPIRTFLILFTFGLFLQGCAETEFVSHVTKKLQTSHNSPSVGKFKVGSPYKIKGRWYYPKENYDHVETGIASWYGPNFHGKQTANGEIFDQNELTAAHRTLQMPSLVRVTNLENGRSIVARVNDRGPFSRNRVIDMSKRGAELLGFKNQGTARVKVETLRQESIAVAEAAKRGIDTAGYEVAVNKTGRLPGARVPPQAQSTTRVASLSRPDIQPAPAAPSSQAQATAQPVRVAQRMEPVERIQLTPPRSMSQQEDQNRHPKPLADNRPRNLAYREPNPATIRGHTKQGRFMPDPVVETVPVPKTELFVQAGSFTLPDNARRLANKLNRIAQADVYPAVVNGRQFYRVRIGPLASVDTADQIMNTLVAQGNNNALIVVD